MTIDIWIKKTGPKNVAKLLEVDPSTVSSWRTYRACPKPCTMQKITQASRGLVTYKDMVETFVRRQK